ncbi:MAG: thiol-disulfide isomerase [Acidobacteria bacterium]|nr:thiol-disulfide isomerase [Acidobacteriota bacterium]
MKLSFFAALCLLFSSSITAEAQVTFNKDVVPIFQRHCQSCHRPGEAAPMSLLTYKEARPWARAIKLKVSTREMPPWHADSKYGPFLNDRRLTDEEITTLAKWVDGGAIEGNPKDLPAPLQFTEGWRIGPPDVVLTMSEEYKVPASGSDEYIYFSVPTNFPEDRYVQAVEIRPGNRKVVHHVLAYVQKAGAGVPSRSDVDRYNRAAGGPIFQGEGFAIRVQQDAPVYDDACALPNGGSALGGDVSGGSRPMLAGYAPGTSADVWPDGMAMRIPAGSEILFQIHYAKTGQPETDRTSIGLVFAKQPETLVRWRWVQNYYFKIPPNASNHKVTGCYTFNEDVRVLAFVSHMHLRGKSMQFQAFYPDGRSEIIFSVPKYDFSWQTTYRLKDPRPIPKGTKIVVTAEYDNSRSNRFNPDPNIAVRWGDPTYDEMMIGEMFYISGTGNRR